MIVRDGPKRPRYPLALIHPLGPLFWRLPLSLRRHLLYLRALRRWGNFRTPRLAGEKMQWRIINDRRPLIALAEDKLASREHQRIALVDAGLQSVVKIPETYWVGTDLRELQAIAHSLPQRWVLKPNHSSGRVIFVDSSSESTDWDAAHAISSRWLARDEEELVFGHWAYSQARRLLVVEEYIGDAEATEIKVHTYGGTPEFLFHSNRMKTGGLYDCLLPDGTRFFPGEGDDRPQSFPAITDVIRHRALEAARAISAPFDEIRTDFYFTNGELWCSEIAAYTASGLARTTPEYDVLFGSRWKLPDLNAPDPREAEWRALLEGAPKGTLQR
jgi:hypothetical protein